jgi:hypothetical protein
LAKAQTIALYAIALLLAGDFVIGHVQPAVVLALNEQEYLGAARKCHEALSNRHRLDDAADQYDRETAFALNLTATVALTDCYGMENLRRLLLARGVNEHDLDRIDLMARNESNTDLWYFVQGVAGGK